MLKLAAETLLSSRVTLLSGSSFPLKSWKPRGQTIDGDGDGADEAHTSTAAST